MVRSASFICSACADRCALEWFTILHKEKYCGEVYLELTFWLDVRVISSRSSCGCVKVRVC